MTGRKLLIAFALLCAPGAAAAQDSHSRSAGEIERMILARGFYSITDLRVDDAGAWRASAIKYDRRWLIDLDERGNLTSVPISAHGDLTPERPERAPANLRLFLVLK